MSRKCFHLDSVYLPSFLFFAPYPLYLPNNYHHYDYDSRRIYEIDMAEVRVRVSETFDEDILYYLFFLAKEHN